MKKILFLVSIPFWLTTCTVPEPEFTLPEEELVKLLYDIQVAEAALQTVHSSVKDSVIAIYYDQVFELHGVDQETLMQNIEVLKKSPIKSNKIYKKVLEYHKEAKKQKK